MAGVGSNGRVETARAQFIAAQLAGDRREALALVSSLVEGGGLTVADVRTGVIRAAQREIGRLWQDNVISIAQEHMATAISHLALAELFQRDRPHAPNGRRVVVACVEGELHEFPARLVADELDLAGFDVRFLGASVPTDTLVSFVERDRPDLLVLSATMAFHAGALRAAVARVRAVSSPPLRIAIGGQVCQWVESLASEVGAEISGCDAAALVDEARALLEVR